MRVALFAAMTACVLVSACGGSQRNEATGGQASSASPASNAAAPARAGAVQVAMTPVDADTAGQLMKQRHDAMGQLGKASKSIKRSLDSTPIDLTAIQQAAPPLFDTTAAKLVGMFPAGTGPDVGKTGAKPDIWKNPQDFAKKASDFEAAGNAFADSLKTFKPDNMKAKFAAVQNTCKACHDKYRAEEKR